MKAEHEHEHSVLLDVLLELLVIVHSVVVCGNVHGGGVRESCAHGLVHSTTTTHGSMSCTHERSVKKKCMCTKCA